MRQFFAGLFILFISSCNNNGNHNLAEPVVSTQPDSTEKNTTFFPVTSFIKGQMLQFDSMPVTPLRILTIKEKTDSDWLKREQLKPLLQAFIEPEIKDTNLNKFFKETKFNDQTINAITFTYDPITQLPDSIDLRTWNVYINPQTGNVIKIYLVKNIKENNQSITQQLTWETNKSAEITDILNKPDGSSEILSQEKFIWNFSE
jgi:hypothetical protein